MKINVPLEDIRKPTTEGIKQFVVCCSQHTEEEVETYEYHWSDYCMFDVRLSMSSPANGKYTGTVLEFQDHGCTQMDVEAGDRGMGNTVYFEEVADISNGPVRLRFRGSAEQEGLANALIHLGKILKKRNRKLRKADMEKQRQALCVSK